MRAALGVVGAGRLFTSTRRRRSARGALAAGLALTLGVAFVAPASAQTPTPATQGSASAYGLQATGLVPIPATPTVSVSTPGQVQQQVTLPVSAAPLAVNGTVTARAECRVEPTVAKRIASATIVTPNNCDGYTRTEGLAVLLSGGALPGDPLAPVPSLVSADEVQSEAVARGVGGRGQVATAYSLTDVRIGGNPVALVNDTVTQVVNLLGPGGLLAPVVTVTQNETGTLPGGGVFVNALHIKILPGAGGVALPGTLAGAEDIIVGHSEARMPTPCGVAAPAGPAAGPDLGLGGGPADLPRTGANQMPAVPLALGMLATAVVLHRVNRRARRASD